MQNDSLDNQLESESSTDPLLDCLLILAKHYGQTASPNTIKANLPLINHQLTPSLFIKAAERVQLSCQLVERPLSKLTDAVLPTVLLLKNNNACIFNKIYEDGTGEFIFPEGKTTRLRISELEKQYIGIAILAKPKFHFEKRADEYHVETQKSWFWDTIWRYRHLYYHVALASLFINLFIMAAPLFVMNVYDRVVTNKAMQTLWVLAIGISVIYIFDFLLKIIRGYLLDVSSKKADVILSSVLFKHLLELQMSVKPASAGAFANSFHGYEAVRDFFTSATLVSLIDLPFILIFILIIAYIGGWIALIPLLAIPIVIFVSIFFEIPIREAVEEGYIGSAQKQAILVESINCLETIKTSLAEGEQLRKWDHYTGLVAKVGMKAHLYSSLAVNFATYILSMVYIIVVVAGVYEINARMLTLGGLIAVAILSSRSLAPLVQIASLITRYHQAKIGLQTLDKVMGLPVDRPTNQAYIHLPQLEGNIEFDNVTFNYPQQLKPAINNVSFKIKAKEKIAILGRIGSGKSTLLKLIIDLYQPTSGSIRLDGIEMHQLDPALVRKSMGYCPQESGLFYGTLRENICKSAPLASHADLLHVAEITGISHYTNEHPSGFDLMIGENGAGLSSGQKQSVAIARALLPNPPIILFDDCTSEIDNNSEAELINNLEKYITDKTLIMVTHKLSMLKLVNRILIIENGRLVADGSKEEILKMLGATTQ